MIDTHTLLSWDSWRIRTKDLYLQQMQGWPVAEMRRYWLAGDSPQEACNKAVRRRLGTIDKARPEENDGLLAYRKAHPEGPVWQSLHPDLRADWVKHAKNTAKFFT